MKQVESDAREHQECPFQPTTNSAATDTNHPELTTDGREFLLRQEQFIEMKDHKIGLLSDHLDKDKTYHPSIYRSEYKEPRS